MSQADLWLKGDLYIDQPFGRQVPWAFGQWTLTPLGYKTFPNDHGIVPTYAPGLPILLAVAKRVGGQCGIRWVGPIASALFIVITFLLGRRIFNDAIAAAGAWLLATSPVVLEFLPQTMSDIPVAAAYGIAAYGAVADSVMGALLGGIATALAIAIRPNLIVVGLVIGMWMLVRDLRRRPYSVSRSALFATAPAVACVLIALLNKRLYGAMTSNGYGDLNLLFQPSRIPVNLGLYAWWLIQSQTPLALAGFAMALAPVALPQRFGVRLEHRVLLAGICAGTLGAYLLYQTFDIWWYLRFLLPCWPALCLTTAWLLARRSDGRFSAVSLAVLVLCGAYGLWFSWHAGMFASRDPDRRYVVIAKAVRDITPPKSIVFSMQHSGSVRYYGGRMTLRYDVLSERWLDRAVAWLDSQHIHPYFLLDEWEIPRFQQRFEGMNELGRLNVARVFEYRGATKTYLYDPLRPLREGEKTTILREGTTRGRDCPPPEPYPALDLNRP